MASEKTRLLVVEDDERISAELSGALSAAGFEVTIAATCQDARWGLEQDYDLMLLDLGLPDGNGLDLCRDLRKEGRSIPIVIVTARDSPEQRVRGLDVGADDYVVKPFHMQEVVARIRTVLRRSGRAAGPGQVKFRDLFADPESRIAKRGSDQIPLTPREFDLLLFLLRHPGRTWTRDQLLDRVWEVSAAVQEGSRTVDLHVRRLRSKLEDDPSDPQYIETVWGVGYRMGDSS